MERFILFFKDSDLENQIIAELIAHPNMDISGVSGMFATPVDSLEELNKLMSTIVAQKNTNLLILIDNEKYHCYIYVAEGNIKQIKSTIMKSISNAYAIICNEELFIAEFKDMRQLKSIFIVDPILN